MSDTVRKKISDNFSPLSPVELNTAVLLHRARTYMLRMDNIQYEKRIFDRELNRLHSGDRKYAGYCIYLKQDIQDLLSSTSTDHFDSCIETFAQIYAHQTTGKRRQKILDITENTDFTEQTAQQFAQLVKSTVQSPSNLPQEVFTEVKEFISFVYPRLRLIVPPVPILDRQLLQFIGQTGEIRRSETEVLSDLKAIQQGTYPEGVTYGKVIVGTTPLLLERLGFAALPLVATRHHLSNIMKSNTESSSAIYHDTSQDHFHNLSANQILAAIQALANPVCIFQSGTMPHRVVAVTDVRDRAGDIIIVPISPACSVRYRNIAHLDVNIVSSIYGKKIENQLKQAIEGNRILYVNKKKSRTCLSSEVQFSGSEGIAELFYTHNIARYINDVNTYILSFNEQNRNEPMLPSFGANIVYDSSRKSSYNPDVYFREHSVLESVGKKIHTINGKISEQGWRELSDILHIYSDKRYESARYLLVKDGTIIDHIALSSKVASSTVTQSHPLFLEELRIEAEQKDCQVVFVHNHPSGVVCPSQEDMRMTDELQQFFQTDLHNRFAGHIILDHGTYGLYDASSEQWAVLTDSALISMQQYTANLEKDTYTQPRLEPLHVQGEIGLLLLAEYAKKVDSTGTWDTSQWVPCCFTDTNNQLTGIHYVDRDAFITHDFEKLKSFLLTGGKSCNACQVYLVVNSFDPQLFDAMEQFASSSAMIKDIYHATPTGYQTSVFNNGFLFNEQTIQAVSIEDSRFYGDKVKKMNNENAMDNNTLVEEENGQLIMRFFQDCQQVETVEQYTSLYERLVQRCPSGQIRFPDVKTISLFIEDSAVPAFSDENTAENTAKLYQYTVQNNILLQNTIPTPQEFNEQGKAVVQDALQVLQDKQSVEYQQAQQRMYENNFDNDFEDLSGINSIETVKEIQEVSVPKQEMSEEEVIRQFAEKYDEVGTEVPPFGRLSENGVNFDIEKGLIYMGSKESEQTVFLGRKEKDGKLTKIPISATLYKSLVNAAVQRITKGEVSQTVLSEYREAVRLHENDTRENTAVNFWHNYKALCRTQANNIQDALNIAKSIVEQMSYDEKNKVMRQFEKYEKLSGRSYTDRMVSYYEKSVDNIPITNKTPFASDSLAWDVRSQVEVIDKAGQRLSSSTKAAIGDVVNITLSFTDPFSNDINRITQPLKITSACRENNKVILMDRDGKSKYTLPYDSFIAQMHKLERQKNISASQER